MKIQSPAFADGEKIPVKYTCEGENIPPPLKFSGVPIETKTLALVVDDPDAPTGTFDHWIVWNLPPNTTHLPEGSTEISQGRNDFGAINYDGPCPPPGRPHRYVFKLYALDTQISIPRGSGKRDLEKAMEGHIIAQAELKGIYQREKK